MGQRFESTLFWHKNRKLWFLRPPSTVCSIEVKVAGLCTHQYMAWILLPSKVLNIFLYIKHQILTRICSEAYLKHNQRNFYQKSERIQFFMTISSIMFKIGFWAYASQDLVLEISKIVQNFDYKHISWHALAWTQNCHLNFNSTHCAEVTVAYTKRAQSA